MTTPFMSFRLVDEDGVVHIDQMISVEDDLDIDMLATMHCDVAAALTLDGKAWRIEIVDPDGVIPPVVIGDAWQ